MIALLIQGAGLPPWLRWTLAGVGVVIAIVLLDQLGLWMERRGRVYWRKVKPKGGGGGARVLGAFQELIEPEVRHVIEERDERKATIDARPTDTPRQSQ